MHTIIGISAFDYDTIGARTLYIEPGAFERLNAGTRRVTRTKTLDGGAVVYDAGYSPSDLILALRFRGSSRFIGRFIAYMGQTYNLVRVTTEYGVFSAALSKWEERGGIVTCDALVVEQIA